MIRDAQLADVPSVLALWRREAATGNADSPWASADLQTIGFAPPNHLHVALKDEEISGAVLIRPSFYVTGEFVERLEPFIAIDRDSEAQLFEWLALRPNPVDAKAAMDLWIPCGSHGLAPSFGFRHIRTFYRMDRESLVDIAPSLLPSDIQLVGPADPRANMTAWAQTYNQAFEGEWRQNVLSTDNMLGFVWFGGGQLSLAAVNDAGETVGLALVRLENRPHDRLAQPLANVWVLCVAANHRCQGIGEGRSYLHQLAGK